MLICIFEDLFQVLFLENSQDHPTLEPGSRPLLWPLTVHEITWEDVCVILTGACSITAPAVLGLLESSGGRRRAGLRGESWRTSQGPEGASVVDMLMWGLDPVAVLESERLKTTVLGAPVQGQGVGKGVWHGGEALEATGFCPSSRISLVDGMPRLWSRQKAGPQGVPFGVTGGLGSVSSSFKASNQSALSLCSLGTNSGNPSP